VLSRLWRKSCGIPGGAIPWKMCSPRWNGCGEKVLKSASI
jgi:hypothetical protein